MCTLCPTTTTASLPPSGKGDVVSQLPPSPHAPYNVYLSRRQFYTLCQGHCLYIVTSRPTYTRGGWLWNRPWRLQLFMFDSSSMSTLDDGHENSGVGWLTTPPQASYWVNYDCGFVLKTIQTSISLVIWLACYLSAAASRCTYVACS